MLGNSAAVPVIHEGLKSSWGVAQAKHHDVWLVEATSCFEGRLVCICFLHVNVIVSLLHIELCVESCSPQITDEVTDEGQQVLVADSVAVNGLIVLYGLQLFILFFNKEERRGVRGH